MLSFYLGQRGCGLALHPAIRLDIVVLLKKVLRQVVWPDGSALGQIQGREDNRFKFPDVTGVIEAQENVHGLVCYGCFFRGPIFSARKGFHQEGNIFFSFPQRQ